MSLVFNDKKGKLGPAILTSLPVLALKGRCLISRKARRLKRETTHVNYIFIKIKKSLERRKKKKNKYDRVKNKPSSLDLRTMYLLEIDRVTIVFNFITFNECLKHAIDLTENKRSVI